MRIGVSMRELKTDQCCGCGYCCLKVRCQISWFVFGTESGNDCPGLIFKDGRFWCRLAEYSGLAKALYIGEGCCSSLFNTQREAFLQGHGVSYMQSIGKGELT